MSQELLLHCNKIGLMGATLGSISFLSTLCVLLIYLLNQSLRTFTFRIVVYLQLSDFLLSLSIIMISLENFEQASSQDFCATQAVLLNYGVLSTSIWTFLITLVMLLSLNWNIQMLKHYEKYYVLVGFGLPLILTIIPGALGYFGHSGYWCWVQEDHEFFVFFFYGIVIFVIIFNAGGMMFILRYLKKLQKMNLVKKTTLFYKLRFYPIVLTILWIFPTFNRFSSEIANYQNNWTHCAHIGCESLVGVTNMVYYALTPKVQTILKNKFKSVFHKKEKEMLLSIIDDPQKDRASTATDKKDNGEGNIADLDA